VPHLGTGRARELFENSSKESTWVNCAIVPAGCLACRSTGYSSRTALIGQSMAAQSGAPGAPGCGWKLTAVERAGTWAASTSREHFPLTDLVQVAWFLTSLLCDGRAGCITEQGMSVWQQEKVQGLLWSGRLQGRPHEVRRFGVFFLSRAEF
jgi:hypothetical protein